MSRAGAPSRDMGIIGAHGNNLRDVTRLLEIQVVHLNDAVALFTIDTPVGLPG